MVGGSGGEREWWWEKTSLPTSHLFQPFSFILCIFFHTPFLPPPLSFTLLFSPFTLYSSFSPSPPPPGEVTSLAYSPDDSYLVVAGHKTILLIHNVQGACMRGCNGACMHGCNGACMHGCIDICVGALVHVRICMDVCVDEGIDGWMNEPMD